MGLTRKGEYAIRGMVHLAKQPPGELLLISEIADAVEVPQSFLAKILQNYTRLGMVRSSRGAGGGFTLAQDPEAISMRAIIEAVEGPIIANNCAMGREDCERSGACMVHPVWLKVQNQMIETLEGVSLKDLAGPDVNLVP